ncbi:MAG TPA: FAD-binding oxidoreductase [Caulobacteraceae bacterium]|nr:FAD-binding oxidoreductase [Caulobacteraceae bacterium]
MKRRQLLGAGLAMTGAAALGLPPQRAAAEAAAARVRPGQPGWPADADWAVLNQATNGHLSPVTTPPKLDAYDAVKLLSNPFYIADQPALTESSGWLDAWRSSPSAYVVTAENAQDVAAAVGFARAHNLRLVIKGRGHSYLGTSNAPDSLLIWTRRMDTVTIHDAFTPAGSSAAPVSAVSVGAGCMWLHAYQAVTVGAGRYVQGGGCTTVGVAGLVQGGGFGSFSKGFGTGAASLLEAEIVTADGKIRVVNQAREPDLFWALKGGGGGAFGVVTRLTLATHELPETFGTVNLTLHARSDAAYRLLLARFVDFYATSLFNPHWGEQVRAEPDNVLDVSMVFQGLTQDQARAAWKPLIDFANANSTDYIGQNSLSVAAVPAKLIWNADLMRLVPGVIVSDSRPGAAPTDFWWAGATEEVGAFWHAYTSAWMPASLLDAQNQSRLVDAWFAASRHWPVSFHFNKGLAGAPAAAIDATRDTATNPDVLSAFALAIIAANGPSLYFGGSPELVAAHAQAARVQAAMTALRVAAPNTGAYVNECDYFQEGWQTAFWGPHYPRLARIKRRYDPDGLFTVHHGVGSEAWSADGFTRVA